MRTIDADALYERTAEWEAQALHMVEVTMNDEDKTKWQKWSTILAERSAFKHDIADAPVIEPEQQWIPVTERLPEEGHDVLITKEPLKIKGYEQRVIKAKRSVDQRSGKIEWWSPEFGTLTNNAVLAWMPLPQPWKGRQDENISEGAL